MKLLIFIIIKYNNMNFNENNMDFNENNIQERLQVWPDYITLKDCKERIEQNQIIVIEQVRSQFCKNIINAINNSIPNIILVFPNNLLNNNRKIIIKELVDRFGALSVTGEVDECTICESNYVNEIEDIPPNPTKIHLEFLKEN